MKTTICLIILLFVATITYAQSEFDKTVNEASADLAQKLQRKNKLKIAVVCITDIVNKEETIAGKYIADEISVNIVNGTGNFEVFDRESLSGIVAVKKLISEGYINSRAKELGKLLSVEAVILGNYTVKNNTIKLTLSAYDSYSGLVIASTKKDLPIDSDAGALLGINVETNSGIDNSKRGFNNRPINSNEDYNNPRTVNSDCKKNNTGDYCFTSTSRKTQFTVTTYLQEGSNAGRTMTLQPLQTQCFYDFPAGPHNYVVTYRAQVPIMSFPPGAPTTEQNVIYLQGQIKIEQCNSKTFVIKIK